MAVAVVNFDRSAGFAGFSTNNLLQADSISYSLRKRLRRRNGIIKSSVRSGIRNFC
jgi:hypothetical protein